MKRGLAFALAALALVAGNVAVQAADIDLSLNLRYTNPGDPDQGGKWFLMAKTNTAGANTGIAGLSVYLSNIDTAGIVFGNGQAIGSGAQQYPVVAGATLGGNVNNGGLPLVTTAAGVTNIVYGQDLVTKLLTIGEGTGTPGVLASDPLRNAAWANSTLLASGTFTGGGTAANLFNRPAFATSGANSTDGNVYNAGGTAVDATVSTIVRGDSVTTFGLNTPATGGIHFGDLNRNGTVAFISDISPALSKIGVAAPPAPISAVPEPATVGMMIVGLAGLAAARRRK